MNNMKINVTPIITVICLILLKPSVSDNSKIIKESEVCSKEEITTGMLKNFIKDIVPDLLQGKYKGEAGRIGIIGGSVEYTGAPYFAAISSLKIGADLVYVITTESAAPVIKSYSPDLIVYPYLNIKEASKINALLPKMDVVVIGPGLGRQDETVKLTEDIIKTCKTLEKPLVIDADGLYVVSKNPTIIQDYPSPGIILTPNIREAKKLQESVSVAGNNNTKWYHYWGENVSVLVKGQTDQFYSYMSEYNWSSAEGGSGRRAAGQGDILSGSLGTVYGWAIKYNSYPNHYHRDRIAQSISAYASARFTRACNSHAFASNGRSMIASDMIKIIHNAFAEVFSVEV